MRAAKAAGLIERFPCGRRRKCLPLLSKNRKIRRCWSRRGEEMSHGEKPGASAGRALDVTKAYLDASPNRH